jgi:hypothetical protein
MTSATTVSVIDIEPEAAIPTNLNDKEKFTKRFKSTNSKRNNKKQKSSSTTTEIPLRADDIKDYRLLTIASSILCFFIIAPFIALYHSRRIREMKKNQELKRAKICSNHVGNILIFSCIIGIVIWIAIFFLIGVLLIMGHFL